MVDLEVPGLTRHIQVNNDFFIFQAKLLESNVSTVSPRAQVVGVEDDLGSRHDDFR